MPPRSRGFSAVVLNSALQPTKPTLRIPFICAQCSSINRIRSFQSRTFTSSPRASKKSSASKKSNRKSPDIPSPALSHPVPDSKDSRNVDSEPDPYDYSLLESAMSSALARLKENLTETRDAGRVSPSMLEQLPVELNIKDSHTQGGSAHKERTRIRDIASVVPRGGRMLHVLCSEDSAMKPVSNAIAASPYSLTPQMPSADANNSLQIEVPIPPVTAETRGQAAEEAKKVFDTASLDIRNARGDAQKRHRRMELQKLVVPDELKKAHKGMEELVRKGQEECKKIYEGALRGLQQ